MSDRGPGVVRVCLLSGLFSMLVARGASAQLATVTTAAAPPGAASAAETFDETYRELLGLVPVGSRVAEVRNRRCSSVMWPASPSSKAACTS